MNLKEQKKEDGNYELAPKRLEELDKRLAQIDEAEQYALVARSTPKNTIKYFQIYNSLIIRITIQSSR